MIITCQNTSGTNNISISMPASNASTSAEPHSACPVSSLKFLHTPSMSEAVSTIRRLWPRDTIRCMEPRVEVSRYPRHQDSDSTKRSCPCGPTPVEMQDPESKEVMIQRTQRRLLNTLQSGQRLITKSKLSSPIVTG